MTGMTGSHQNSSAIDMPANILLIHLVRLRSDGKNTARESMWQKNSADILAGTAWRWDMMSAALFFLFSCIGRDRADVYMNKVAMCLLERRSRTPLCRLDDRICLDLTEERRKTKVWVQPYSLHELASVLNTLYPSCMSAESARWHVYLYAAFIPTTKSLSHHRTVATIDPIYDYSGLTMTGATSLFDHICSTYSLTPDQGPPFYADRTTPDAPLESVIVSRCSSDRTKPLYPGRDVDVIALPQFDFQLSVETAGELTKLFRQVRIQFVGEMLNHLDSQKTIVNATSLQQLNHTLQRLLEQVLHDRGLTLGMEYSPVGIGFDLRGLRSSPG